MRNIDYTEKFYLSVTLIVGALKLQNMELVEACKKTLVALIGSEHVKSIMTVAIFQISDSDSSTFQWILKNLYDLEGQLTLKEGAIMFAIQKLTSRGFILGQDFSANHTGEILIKQNAKDALMANTSALGHLFLEEILHTVD
ncbi:MAG: hypothetical protein F6K58_20180 [Symploca sp. SIO2E9]|nr:hypothetical protein [Symploca sp. SIO2E9]